MLPRYCFSALEETQAIIRDFVAKKKKVPVCSVFYIKDQGFHIAHFPDDVTESEFFTASISFANIHRMTYFVSVHTCKLIKNGGEIHLPRTKEEIENDEANECAVLLVYQRLGKYKFGCESLWAAEFNKYEGTFKSWYEYDAVNFQKKT